MGIHYHVVNLTKRETLPLFVKRHELTPRERVALYLLLVEAPPEAGLVGRWCGDAVALVTEPAQLRGADGSVPSLPPHDLEALSGDLFEDRLPVLPLDELIGAVGPVVAYFSDPKPELPLLATTVRKLRKHPLFSARFVPCDLDLRESLDPVALRRTHGAGPLWQDLSGTAAPRALVQLVSLGERWSGHRIAIRPAELVHDSPDVSALVDRRDADIDPPEPEGHRDAWRALDVASAELEAGRLREGALALREPLAWLGPLARAVPWRSWDLSPLEELVSSPDDAAPFRRSAGELRRAVDALRGLLCVVC